MTQVNPLTARFGLAILLCMAMMSLVACGSADVTAPNVTGPSDSSQGTQPSEPSEASEALEPVRDSEAIISVAGVDVDGTHVSASGYVSSIIENDGLCSFVFTGDDDVDRTAAERTVTATAVANVTTTSCGLVQIPVTELAAGTWSLVLTYTSDSLTVTSAPTTLEIP